MLNNHFYSIFLSNKYSKYYYNIITNALQADRKKLPKTNKNFVYYESHHVIPKSVKPEFKDWKLNPWNKVLLTPKEHFICHLLLTKMLSGKDKNKMVYALWGMTNQASKYQGDRFKSNLYAAYKIKMQQSLTSDRKGKSYVERYGEEKAIEIRKKQSASAGHTRHTEEHKQKVSKLISDYWKANPGKAGFASRPQLPNVTCECCGKSINPGAYAQFHGKNCRTITRVCPTCNTSFLCLKHEDKKYCCFGCYTKDSKGKPRPKKSRKVSE